VNDINIKPNPAKQQFEFVIKRTFNAPRGRVWQAWTEADHLGKWWGPAGFDIVSVKLDLRPGGTFHYCLRAPTARTCGASSSSAKSCHRNGWFSSSPSPMRKDA
jgi:activator of Hsp90 ATPase-like protein